MAKNNKIEDVRGNFNSESKKVSLSFDAGQLDGMLEAEIERLISENKELKAKLEALEGSDAAKDAEKIAELENQIAANNKELEEKLDQIGALENEVLKIKEKYEKAVEAKKKAEEKVKTTKADLNNKLAHRKDEIVQLKADLKIAERNLEEANAEHERAVELITERETKIAYYVYVIRELKESKKRAEGHIVEGKENLANAEEHYSHILAELRTEKSLSESKINELMASLEDARKELVEVRYELVEKDKELAETKAELGNKITELAQKDAELAEKIAQVAQKDVELAARLADIADRDAQLTIALTTIAQTNGELAEKIAELAEKENAIFVRDSLIGSQEELIEEQVLALAQKDAELAAKIDEIAQKDASLAAAIATIASKDAALASKVAEIAAKDNQIFVRDSLIGSQEELIEQQGLDIGSLIDALAQKDAALASKLTELTNKDAEIVNKNIELAAATGTLSHMESELNARGLALSNALAQIASKDEELAAKLAEIALKENAIFVRDSLIDSQAELIEEQRLELAAKLAEIASKDTALANALAEIASKDTALAAKMAELAERDNAIFVRDSLIDSQAELIDEQKAAIASKDAAIAMLSRGTKTFAEESEVKKAINLYFRQFSEVKYLGQLFGIIEKDEDIFVEDNMRRIVEEVNNNPSKLTEVYGIDDYNSMKNILTNFYVRYYFAPKDGAGNLVVVGGRTVTTNITSEMKALYDLMTPEQKEKLLSHQNEEVFETRHASADVNDVLNAMTLTAEQKQKLHDVLTAAFGSYQGMSNQIQYAVTGAGVPKAESLGLSLVNVIYAERRAREQEKEKAAAVTTVVRYKKAGTGAIIALSGVALVLVAGILHHGVSGIAIKNENAALAADNAALKDANSAYQNQIAQGATYEDWIKAQQAEMAELVEFNNMINDYKLDGTLTDIEAALLQSKIYDYAANDRADIYNSTNEMQKTLDNEVLQGKYDKLYSDYNSLLASQTPSTAFDYAVVVEDVNDIVAMLANSLADNSLSAKEKADIENAIKNVQSYGNAVADKYFSDFGHDISVVMNSIEYQINTLQGDIANLNAAITTLTNENKDLSTKVALKNKEIKLLKDEITRLEGEIARLDNLLQNSGSDPTLLAEITKLRAELDAANKKVIDLELANDALTQENADLKTQVSSLNSTITGLNTQVSGLTKDVSDLNAQIATLKTENGELLIERDEALALNAAYAKEIQDLNKQYDAALANYNTLVKTYEELVEKYNALVNAGNADEYIAEIEKLEKQIDTLEAQLDKMDGELDETSKKLDAAEAEISRLTNELAKADGTMDRQYITDLYEKLTGKNAASMTFDQIVAELSYMFDIEYDSSVPNTNTNSGANSNEGSSPIR